MEIRCAKCGHLGVAKDVRPIADGVGLVCAECEHVNAATAGGSESEDSNGSDGNLEALSSSGSADSGEAVSVLQTDLAASIEHLLPEPGSGRRCRKCAHLFEDEAAEHCSRCGLSIAEAEKYADGEAPWEQPPEGKGEEYRQAMRLWDDAVDSGEAEKMGDYVDYVIAEDLIEVGMRRMQRYLVSCPDDAAALQGLRQLAKGLEVAMEVARTRAESQSDEFNDDVKRVRSGMMVGALIFWIVIFLLFSWMFLGNV